MWELGQLSRTRGGRVQPILLARIYPERSSTTPDPSSESAGRANDVPGWFWSSGLELS